MSTTIIKRICSVCGSADVIRDATVAWSEPAQAWELVTVSVNGYCNACGNSGSSAIEDVEVTMDVGDFFFVEGEPTKSQIVERIAAELGLPVIQIKASEAAPDDTHEAEHALLLKDHLDRQRWNKACDHAIDTFLKKHEDVAFATPRTAEQARKFFADPGMPENTRLIAAAPGLLAALQSILRVVNDALKTYEG